MEGLETPNRSETHAQSKVQTILQLPYDQKYFLSSSWFFYITLKKIIVFFLIFSIENQKFLFYKFKFLKDKILIFNWKFQKIFFDFDYFFWSSKHIFFGAGNKLGHIIFDAEKWDLSIYAVSRAIPALLHRFWEPFIKSPFFTLIYNGKGDCTVWRIYCVSQVSLDFPTPVSI